MEKAYQCDCKEAAFKHFDGDGWNEFRSVKDYGMVFVVSGVGCLMLQGKSKTDAVELKAKESDLSTITVWRWIKKLGGDPVEVHRQNLVHDWVTIKSTIIAAKSLSSTITPSNPAESLGN